ARPMTAEARSICWTVWARETSCSLTAPTTPTLCVRRSRNAAPGRASNQCPDASSLRLSVPFFIVTETSSSASSTNSSTSAPSPRDTKNTPTTTSHSSSSLPSEYGCDLMSLCLRADRAKSGSRSDPIWCVNLLYLFDVDRIHGLVRHQQRHGHVSQQGAGHAAEDQVPQARMGIGAQDDQVGAIVRGPGEEHIGDLELVGDHVLHLRLHPMAGERERHIGARRLPMAEDTA